MDNLGNISHWPSHSLCAEKEENDGLSFGIIYIYIFIKRFQWHWLPYLFTTPTVHLKSSPLYFCSQLLVMASSKSLDHTHNQATSDDCNLQPKKKIMIIKKPPFYFSFSFFFFLGFSKHPFICLLLLKSR